ncbi:TolC family protein [Pseudobacteriovorax antillogorgiicola]|uniref:Outer membrane protein TolC n=1 Tax=Pseudobacteriovorax antillogorgiicola TaxID=1513793 RepID=A0A1Y6BM43_9BACT|nr:TolC family protein [Pseudobacteriovorax antillogorgiicola]TCS54673.1 outer membrane protein TolC [Pseudobacteriovorax antillogorgiicola]SMF16675.1 Outer membrane protein TolC [Pseudobacteriovorax antillogorgiicola]
MIVSKLQRIYLLFVLFLTLIGPIPAYGLQIEEAYRAALKFRAEILNADLNIRQADLEKSLLRVEYYPQISINSDAGIGGDFDDGEPTDQHRTSIGLTQPLYRGGLLSAGFDLADSVVESAKLQRQLAAIELYQNVAQLFFTVLSFESEVDHLKSQQDALEKRIRVIKTRTEIGRSKATDLIAAQAQLARVQAQLSENQGRLAAAQLQLASLMGQRTRPESLYYRYRAEAIPKAWSKRVMSQPRVAALEKALEEARLEEDVLRSRFWPQVDASLQVSPLKSESSSYNDWDVGISATWLLYDGGVRSAQMASQSIEAQKLQHQLENAKLAVQNEFQELSDQIRAVRIEVKNLKKAVRLAKQNYDLHQKEYDAGLVSILDVLRVFDDYLILQRSLSTRQYSEALLFHQLKAKVGVLP